MRTRALPPFLAALCGIFLASCSSAATPRPTLAPPSPTPFGLYGQTLTDVTYCTMDGLPQKMDIYIPGSGGPWPVFLYVHGGGWNAGDKAEGAGWKYLNADGYLVVSVNYRLAAYNIKFPAMIQDVKCAVRYLRAHASDYNLNPDRIGAMGASAGAHLVALLGTAGPSAGWDVGEYLDQSSKVQGVIVEAVFSDFTRPMPNSISFAIYFALGDLPGTSTPGLVAASPVTYVAAGDPPFLILHGDQDGYSPVDQAQTLDAHLKAAGVPSTLVIVQGGDHGLNGTNGNPTVPSKDQIAQMILDFLNTNLKK